MKALGTGRELLLKVLSAAAFLIFFQSYMIAPLITTLATDLHSSEKLAGLVVPAYMLPYGISTLFYGPLSDRYGRRKLLLLLMGLSVVTALLPAFAQSADMLLAFRVLAGLTLGGIVPISLALLGDLFPYEERGRAIGWLFGAIAGGMAFGSTLGAFLNPILGWRMEFKLMSLASLIVFGFALWKRDSFPARRSEVRLDLGETFKEYLLLVQKRRGFRTFSYIFVNGMFHSGVFSWLGFYFSKRFGLGDQGVGLALLGYGVPGMIFGPAVGRAADQLGRRHIIPIGLWIAALSAALLIPQVTLWVACVAITVLSFGFDMSHPLLAGIVSDLNPEKRGQSMGLNAFFLFMGFGSGALIFQYFLKLGIGSALGIFAGVQIVFALVSLRAFQEEGRLAVSTRDVN